MTDTEQTWEAPPRPRAFDGDTGTLDIEARPVFVKLLQGPFLSVEKNVREWDLFLKHRTEIVARMNDLLLDVHVDLERQVAYRTQVREAIGIEAPVLLHAQSWTIHQAIALLVLRGHFALNPDGTAVISEEEIIAGAEEFLSPGVNDRSRYRLRVTEAVTKLRTAGLIARERQGSNLFRIDPMIEIVLNAGNLPQFVQWLEEHGVGPDLAGDGGSADNEEQADGDE